jgi:predicted GNAT family N-acyltransferase
VRPDISIDVVKSDFTAQIARKRIVVETKWRKEGVDEKIIDNALSVLHPTGIPYLDLCL